MYDDSNTQSEELIKLSQRICRMTELNKSDKKRDKLQCIVLFYKTAARARRFPLTPCKAPLAEVD